MDKVWTILELINWGKTFFTEKNIDSPRLTIELMLAHVLQMPRIQLYTTFDRPLLQTELDTLRHMVRRRAKREPLQYILGEAYFYDIVVEVNSDVLIPRPETELLVEYALKNIPDNAENLRLLDIGTGSGCIALAIAKARPNISITAIDYSEGALLLAQKNAMRLGIKNIEFLQADILQSSPNLVFDVIVSNPPYISALEMQELEPEVLEFEPQSALTDGGTGLSFYQRFGDIFSTILAPNGVFVVEIGFGQKGDVAAIFTQRGFDIEVVNDIADIPRVCAGRFHI